MRIYQRKNEIDIKANTQYVTKKLHRKHASGCSENGWVIEDDQFSFDRSESRRLS